ncbi:MAG: nitroreductase family protein [Bacteroidales bacterium]|nr:nitroreductase family protein [Bacteroidales bacterium]
MDLKQAIEIRTSIRNFTEEKVPVGDLKELVRRAGLAPSVNNYQPWKFYVVTNKEVLSKMAYKVAERIKELPANSSIASDNVKSQVEWFATFFENAPAVIAMTMEDYESVLEKGVELSHEKINKMRNFPDLQSAGAAIQNMLLSAVDMGYGACWLSAPMMAKDTLEEILEIKEPHHLIAFVAVGKSARELKPKSKKSIDEIFKLID